MASLSMTSLFSFFAGEQKSIDRGENHYKSDHVESFYYCAGLLKGEVQASMKKKVYKVMVFLDENMCIKSTECECPRGEFKCSHAAAILIYAYNNLSRTDVECQWKKKKPAKQTSQSAKEMFQHPKKYKALQRKPDSEDRAWLYDELRRYGKFTGLCWLLSPEPEPVCLNIKTIEDIIYSEAFLCKATTDEQVQYMLDNVKVCQREIEEVSSLTKAQRNSPAWHMIRKGRLTASNFGSVLKTKRVTPSLIKRLLGEYDISRVRAVAWGIDNESEAIKEFSRKTGLHPVETGVWLDESGVLGATPDALVGEESVLEVKCPYTQRDQLISEAVKSTSFCLEADDDGKLSLKTDHVYWHQVQGQMFLTKRTSSYFVVWTTKDTAIVLIQRDESWKPNLEIMKDFYCYHLFPKIIQGEL